jgi:hypothetical protein
LLSVPEFLDFFLQFLDFRLLSAQPVVDVRIRRLRKVRQGESRQSRDRG